MDNTHTLESIGESLKKAREAKQWTRAHVASELRLTESIIEKLEADDVTSGPSPVFMRGYLRAYAKIVDIPSDAVTAALQTLHIADITTDYAPNEKITLYRTYDTKTKKIALYIALVIIFFAFAMVWHHVMKPAAPVASAPEQAMQDPINASPTDETTNTASDASDTASAPADDQANEDDDPWAT